jgi:hypothetical protein
VTLYETEDGARMLGSLFDARELQSCTSELGLDRQRGLSLLPKRSIANAGRPTFLRGGVVLPERPRDRFRRSVRRSNAAAQLDVRDGRVDQEPVIDLRPPGDRPRQVGRNEGRGRPAPALRQPTPVERRRRVPARIGRRTPTRLYRVGNSTHLDQTWHIGLPPDTASQVSEAPVDVYELAPVDASSLPLLTKSQD